MTGLCNRTLKQKPVSFQDAEFHFRGILSGPHQREHVAPSAEPWTPRASHEGELKIGDVTIPCAVLDDDPEHKRNTRVLTQRGVFVALGRHKNPTKGQSTIDDRPAFLSAKNLEPFIGEDLRRSWTPIKFRLSGRGGGYHGNIAFERTSLLLFDNLED